MLSLNGNEKITFENCGTSVTKINLSRHKTRCNGGALYCPKCPNFSTKSKEDLNYQIAKQHSLPRPSITYKCKLCHAEFPGFYALRHHKNTQHGTQTGFGASNYDVEDIVGDVDDQSLREKLQSCRHFLVDSEIQKGRHSVFNFAVNNLAAQVIEEKLDRVLDKLKCVAKPNLALGFILKNIEDGIFRYFYAHENNALLVQSKLVSNKDDMAKLKEILKKTDVIESRTKERSNTKWRFFKLTNLTIFAALLRDVTMGGKDAILPESLLKNHTVNCLTFELKYKKTLQWQILPFQSLCSPLAWKWETRGRNIKVIPTLYYQQYKSWPFKISKSLHGWYSICGRYSGYQYFHIRHQPYWRRNDWGTCTTKHQKVWEECSIDTI